MHLNYPETILPHLWSVEKLSSTKPAPSDKRLGTVGLEDSHKDVHYGAVFKSKKISQNLTVRDQ